MSGLVGVDIGATAVRAVELTGVDAEGFALISRIGIAPLPAGSVLAGRVRNPRAVAVALVRALRTAGASRQGFILGLTTPDIALTTMTFPSTVRASERETAIRALGQPLSPSFGLEQSVIATYLAGTATQEGQSMHAIGVAAARSDDLEALREVCDIARCSPRAVDLTAAATLRSLVRVNTSAEDVATVVDVGASKITVATRQGMFLRSVRTTVGAGDEITRAIATAGRMEFEQADEQKMSMSLAASTPSLAGYGMDEDALAGPRRSPVEAALSTSVDMMVDAIAQSIEADAANYGTMSQGLTLTGGTSLLQGFKNRVQSRTGIPVSIGRPWAEIERSRRNAAFFQDGKVDPRVLIMLAPAAGLALWKDRA